MTAIRQFQWTAVAGAALLASGCLGSSSGSDDSREPGGDSGPPLYSIGGQVDGLVGEELILRLNGDELLSVESDGSFAFTGELAEGDDYTVEVAVLPEGPAQNCDLSGESGTMAAADVSDIEISCHLAIAMSGRVAGPVVPDALITVEVGEESYETQADEQGMYTLRLSLRDPEAMVFMEALNPSDGFVRYQGYPGSIGALHELATEAGILTREQTVAVNISNMSTAAAALMRRHNEGEAPSSDEIRAELRQDISPRLRLRSAALIQIAVLDKDRTISPALANVGGLASPGGADDTAALIEDEESQTSYEAEVEEKDPEAIDNTIASMVEDEDLVEAADEDDVPDSWFSIAGTQPNIITGDILEFNDDGSGLFANMVSQSTFTWAMDGNRIDVALDSPIIVSGFCFVDHDGDEFQTACVSEYDDIDITILEKGDPADLISIHHVGERRYPDIDKDNEAVDFRAERLAYSPADIVPFAADDIEGATWSLPGAFSGLSGGLQGHGDELLTFLAGGMGEASESGSFNWSFTDEGWLKIDFGNGVSHEVGIIRSYVPPLDLVSVQSINMDGERRSNLRGTAARQGTEGFNAAFAIDLFMQWGTEANRFAIDLREDGWGGPITMLEDFSEPEENHHYLFDYRFENGRLLMETWAQPVDDGATWWGRESICDDSRPDDCYLTFVRSWDHLADDGNRITIREKIVNLDADGEPISVSPRTIQYTRFQK